MKHLEVYQFNKRETVWIMNLGPMGLEAMNSGEGHQACDRAKYITVGNVYCSFEWKVYNHFTPFYVSIFEAENGLIYTLVFTSDQHKQMCRA